MRHATWHVGHSYLPPSISRRDLHWRQPTRAAATSSHNSKQKCFSIFSHRDVPSFEKKALPTTCTTQHALPPPRCHAQDTCPIPKRFAPPSPLLLSLVLSSRLPLLGPSPSSLYTCGRTEKTSGTYKQKIISLEILTVLRIYRLEIIGEKTQISSFSFSPIYRLKIARFDRSTQAD